MSHNGENASSTIKPTVFINTPMLKTCPLSMSLSKAYRRTASPIVTVNNGNNKEIVVVIRSAIPYSLVDRHDVYNGTKKNVNNLEPNDPNCH